MFTIHLHLYRRIVAICTFLLVLTAWKKTSKDGNLWKLAVFGRQYYYFCTNWPKAVSLTCFKTVSDVDLQYTPLCRIFRKIFCSKAFSKYSKAVVLTVAMKFIALGDELDRPRFIPQSSSPEHSHNFFKFSTGDISKVIVASSKA